MKIITAQIIILSTLILFLTMDLSSISLAQGLISSDDHGGEPSNSLPGGVSRFLAQRRRRFGMTSCNKKPRICRVKGSPGSSCCKRRCVDTSKDRLNCGRCGNKCRYSEICCRGKCVNPMSHRKNCGGCDNRCKKGSKCVYAICSYST